MKNEEKRGNRFLRFLARYDFAFLIIWLFSITIAVFLKSQPEERGMNYERTKVLIVESDRIIKNDDSLDWKSLEDLIDICNIEHPEIFKAQVILESDRLNSNICKWNNNFTGMKHAKQRPTTSIGEMNGHAFYRKWQDCVFDYLIWQSRYAKKLTEEEYFKYLEDNYASDPNYVKKLKQIIKQEFN